MICIRKNKFVFYLSLSAVMFAMCSSIPYATVFASNIPIASTVVLQGPVSADEGLVVIADEEQASYALSAEAVDPRVYGVIAAKPPVVFSTGTNTVPVIAEGVAIVQVTRENGPIARGDFLVTADTPGMAMRASDEDQYVFAVALESFDGETDTGRIQAEVGADKAQAARSAAREAAAASEGEGDPDKTTTIIRGAIAAVLAIGALFFVLYSFRSAIVQGVTSVGRNPRARIPIMTLSVANVLFALVLFAIIVFVAVAILVLPL